MWKSVTSSMALIAALAVSWPAMAGGSEETALSKYLDQGARQLTGPEMLQRYVANTLSGETPDGTGFHVYMADRQTFRMRYQGKISAGRWRASDENQFCYTVGADPAEYCTRELVLGENIISINPDGTLAGTARIRTGNPEGL